SASRRRHPACLPSRSPPCWRCWPMMRTRWKEADVTAGPAQTTAERRFYEDALTQAARAEPAVVHESRALDAVIAELRLRLRTLFQKEPEDFALFRRGMDVLRRLVSTRYALSREDRREMDEALERMEAFLRARGEGGPADDHDA